jgi:uncharacterized protein (DUF2252 family)
MAVREAAPGSGRISYPCLDERLNQGRARIMAVDLAGTPVADLGVQLRGDAHLSNFGMFASPKRRLMSDLNDFDESLPGPFEYDVKRTAANFVITDRDNGFARPDTRAAAMVSVTAYPEAMVEFAELPTMEAVRSHRSGGRCLSIP